LTGCPHHRRDAATLADRNAAGDRAALRPPRRDMRALSEIGVKRSPGSVRSWSTAWPSMTILAKPPRRGTGVVQIDPVHSQSAAAATLKDLPPSSGWQDETIASTHDQHFVTRFSTSVEVLPKQPSLVGQSANRTVERLLHDSLPGRSTPFCTL
jgi:hypothetical protein